MLFVRIRALRASCATPVSRPDGLFASRAGAIFGQIGEFFNPGFFLSFPLSILPVDYEGASERGNDMISRTNSEAGAVNPNATNRNESLTRNSRGLRVRTNVKAGALAPNHNESLTRTSRGLRVRTNVKAGTLAPNHNETLTSTNGGLRVRTNVKAGAILSNHNETLVQ
jgi:hypothetical protein